jgi:hypothetical protein
MKEAIDKIEPVLEALQEVVSSHKDTDEVLVSVKHLKLIKNIIEAQVIIAVKLDNKLEAKNKRINYLKCKIDNLASELIRKDLDSYDRFSIKG